MNKYRRSTYRISGARYRGQYRFTFSDLVVIYTSHDVVAIALSQNSQDDLAAPFYFRIT